ncbi:MAG: hypothetical protein LC130_12455 [Bryobacterales bacterium]|nr:hypothetical protein [Bryobacterales bacterium]
MIRQLLVVWNNYPFMQRGFTVHSRAPPAEIQQLYADPWAMYRLRTVVHPVAVAEPSGFKPYWLRRSTQIIGGGVA